MNNGLQYYHDENIINIVDKVFEEIKVDITEEMGGESSVNQIKIKCYLMTATV